MIITLLTLGLLTTGYYWVEMHDADEVGVGGYANLPRHMRLTESTAEPSTVRELEPLDPRRIPGLQIPPRTTPIIIPGGLVGMGDESIASQAFPGVSYKKALIIGVSGTPEERGHIIGGVRKPGNRNLGAHWSGVIIDTGSRGPGAVMDILRAGSPPTRRYGHHETDYGQNYDPEETERSQVNKRYLIGVRYTQRGGRGIPRPGTSDLRNLVRCNPRYLARETTSIGADTLGTDSHAVQLVEAPTVVRAVQL